jgi:hypothetical protein
LHILQGDRRTNTEETKQARWHHDQAADKLTCSACSVSE